LLNQFQYQLEIAIQPKDKGFQVLAKRWIVEPTFAWFAWYRPLSLDYQRESLHSENMISIAMIQLMLKRL
jgi:putative transposase